MATVTERGYFFEAGSMLVSLCLEMHAFDFLTKSQASLCFSLQQHPPSTVANSEYKGSYGGQRSKSQSLQGRT